MSAAAARNQCRPGNADAGGAEPGDQRASGHARRRIAAARVPRRRVALSGEDTGIGIPPEDLPRIFDLYFTTKEKGSGIGLSMVFRIVQLHDGEVEVQSTPGGGTKFTLFFPQAITQELNAELGQ